MRVSIAAIVLSVLLLGGSASAEPDRQRIETLNVGEISALQRRLTDAKCYSGPIDGHPTEETKAAVNACPDQRPQLRIETGMHVAAINQIGIDVSCHLAATTSEDKTIRLWSLLDGKLLRTLRPSIGPGQGGRAYAAAISPDGRYVASGGWDASYESTGRMSVTIFDAVGGAIIARVGAFQSTIEHFTWSADGRWLALNLGYGGVRIIATATWQVTFADKTYSDSYGAVFAPDGRLYTVSYDGKLRRYSPGPAFAEEGEIVTRGGKRPYSVAIDPAGTRIAVGFNDGAAVDFYDVTPFQYSAAADTEEIDPGNLRSVAWSGDGRTLVAGGTYQQWFPDEYHTAHVVTFDRLGRRLGEKPLARNTIFSLATCGRGFIVGAADPSFGLLEKNGMKQMWREGVAPDMRVANKSEFLTVAANATRVRFRLRYDNYVSVMFDLSRATLADARDRQIDLAPALTEGLPVTGWHNALAPQFNGRPIAGYQNEVSHSLAISSGHDGFVLGGASSLQAFDASGAPRWKKTMQTETWGVDLSTDGRIVVAAHADGTIRWYRWMDGRELLALFVNVETRAWVAWTPSGYYTASPGGGDMIGWHVNRGWDQAADFFPASKFRDQFSRPDIVEKVLDTLDEAEAVKQANAARGGRVAPAKPILDALPPIISILSPADGAGAADVVRLDYLVRSPSGLPVDAVESLIDGRPTAGSRGLQRIGDGSDLAECLAETHGLGRTEGGLQGCRGSLTVDLPAGAHEIGLFARSGDKTSDVVRVRLATAQSSRGTGAGDALLKPKLYALVVGISAYANKAYALAYPAKDARDFAAALQNQKGGLYGNVEIRALADGQATAGSIREGLDWLTKQVTSRDVGVVYLAGHGMLDERERFYFLAADSDGSKLRSTAVPREDIADALDALPGKALLFLDACHSGAVVGSSARRSTVDINTVVNDFARSERGTVVFAASTGRQVSQENDAWHNGAFTKAVVEGLGLPGSKGKADLVGAGTITTSELDAYVTNRVKDLTGGGQSPVMIRPPTVPDFPLAMAR